MRIQRLCRITVAAIALASSLLINMQAARAADLTQYISPEFCAVLVIHPDRIGESTLGEAVKSVLPKEIGGDPAALIVANLKKQKDPPKGMDADKLVSLLKGKTVHRVVLMIDSTMEKNNTPNAAMIVQFGSDIDGEGILSAVTTEWQPGEANGVKYRKMKGKPGEADGAAVAPDSRMLIFGVESTVAKMLANNEGERPLLKQLQKASLKHDILVEVYVEPLLAGLAKSTGKSADVLLAQTGNPELAKDVKSLSLQLDFSGTKLLHAEVGTGKPDTAAKLVGMGLAGVADCKQQFEAVKKQPPPFIPPPLVPVLSKLGDEIFAGLQIKSEGSLLTADLPMPDSLPDALKEGAKMIAPLVANGGNAAAPPPGGP